MATMKRFTRTAIDTRGCEFRYTACLGPRDWRIGPNGMLEEVRECRYEAMGVVAESLAELKRKIGELP
ncbi:MAG: hypothetical protein ABFD92_21505 [Planctomycetaceae bacterium]